MTYIQVEPIKIIDLCTENSLWHDEVNSRVRTVLPVLVRAHLFVPEKEDVQTENAGCEFQVKISTPTISNGKYSLPPVADLVGLAHRRMRSIR